MFFAEGEIEKFSKEIRKKISNLMTKDKEIYHLNEKNKDIDSEVINFTISALNLFLKYEKMLNDEQKRLMTEAIGSIPLTFFVLDKLKVNKKIEDIIDPLMDMVDAHANLDIDRKKLIFGVLEKLEELKN